MDIRKQLLERRYALSVENVEFFSSCICEKADTFIEKGMRIGIYQAMSREADVFTLFNRHNASCSFALPISKAEGKMEFYAIDRFTNYRRGRYGILEPCNGEQVIAETFDIVFIPMVGFDIEKHRIGHGQGYYDRWLAKTKALKIGIAFECQKCEHLPIQPHDICMDMIITEKHIYL